MRNTRSYFERFLHEPSYSCNLPCSLNAESQVSHTSPRSGQALVWLNDWLTACSHSHLPGEPRFHADRWARSGDRHLRFCISALCIQYKREFGRRCEKMRGCRASQDHPALQRHVSSKDLKLVIIIALVPTRDLVGSLTISPSGITAKPRGILAIFFSFFAFFLFFL